MKWMTLTAALMVCCVSTNSADAGLFNFMKKGHGCCAPAPACCAPAAAPVCAAPAPAPVCAAPAPAPVCAAPAPAPKCCAPAPAPACCAPAHAGCGHVDPCCRKRGRLGSRLKGLFKRNRGCCAPAATCCAPAPTCCG